MKKCWPPPSSDLFFQKIFKYRKMMENSKKSPIEIDINKIPYCWLINNWKWFKLLNWICEWVKIMITMIMIINRWFDCRLFWMIIGCPFCVCFRWLNIFNFFSFLPCQNFDLNFFLSDLIWSSFQANQKKNSVTILHRLNSFHFLLLLNNFKFFKWWWSRINNVQRNKSKIKFKKWRPNYKFTNPIWIIINLHASDLLNQSRVKRLCFWYYYFLIKKKYYLWIVLKFYLFFSNINHSTEWSIHNFFPFKNKGGTICNVIHSMIIIN